MAGRPTIADLARQAGVSVATVDRVLNGRLPVREETARRVYEAAEAIGYHAATLIRRRIERDLPQYRLGFLLRKPRQYFYQQFTRELETAAAEARGFKAIPVIDYVDGQAPDEIVAKLKSVAARSQAVGVVTPDHPKVVEAVEELKAKGMPIFALLSDFAPGVRDAYIGLDNLKAGRTAAWLIANTAKRAGAVAIFVGSHRFHGHELREIGLRSYFRENAPDFEVHTIVNLETRQITYEATLELLERRPDLVGLYVAGGGMEGAMQALREEGIGRGIVAVVPELTPDSRAALADGVISMAVGTPLPRICRTVIAQMARALEAGASEAAGQIFLPLEIFLPENI